MRRYHLLAVSLLGVSTMLSAQTVLYHSKVIEPKPMSLAYSGAIRTPIPALPGQSFRDKPDTDSAINQPF